MSRGLPAALLAFALAGCLAEDADRVEPRVAAGPFAEVLAEAGAGLAGTSLWTLLDVLGAAGFSPDEGQRGWRTWPADDLAVSMLPLRHDHRADAGVAVHARRGTRGLAWAVLFDGGRVTLFDGTGGVDLPRDAHERPAALDYAALAADRPDVFQPVWDDAPNAECTPRADLDWRCAARVVAPAGDGCLGRLAAGWARRLRGGAAPVGVPEATCFAAVARALAACATPAGLDACDDGDACNGVERCRITDAPGARGVCDVYCGADAIPDGACPAAAVRLCLSGLAIERPCSPLPPALVGRGRCHQGMRVRVAGVDSACEGYGAPGAEDCNGEDDDCDGRVDEGAVRACHLARCARDGVEVCRDGLWAGCEVPSPETCVCEPGRVEACWPGPAHQEGVGRCVPGKRECAADGSAWSPCLGAVLPADEVCDGRQTDAADDDCDGRADEGFGLGAGCVAGIGRCARAGHVACREAGDAACDVAPGEPAPEACNGEDDDCDGRVDEVPPMPCGDGPEVGACHRGERRCTNGRWEAACVGEVRPRREVCSDHTDNDCDGDTDEDCRLP